MNLHEILTSKITRDNLRLFIEKHANDKYTLDIGCANSPYSRYFSERVGFDIAAGTGVDVVGDAHTLPFPDETFDQILCTEVLEHLHTPERAIKEMGRVLKPGGVLLLTTRFIFPIHDAPHDYFRYTKYGLKHLFRDWELLTLDEETDTVGTIAVLMQRIGFQTRLRMNKLLKVTVFALARLVGGLRWFIVEEYGDIKKSVPEKHILASGYYLTAKKR